MANIAAPTIPPQVMELTTIALMETERTLDALAIAIH